MALRDFSVGNLYRRSRIFAPDAGMIAGLDAVKMNETGINAVRNPEKVGRLKEEAPLSR